MSGEVLRRHELWRSVVKLWPGLVVVLVGVTATAFYNEVGPYALVIIWCVVVVSILVLYAFQKRGEVEEPRKGLGEASTNAPNTPSTDMMGEEVPLESQENGSPEIEGQLVEAILSESASPDVIESATVLIDMTLKITEDDDYASTSRKVKRGTLMVTAESPVHSFRLLILDSKEFSRYSRDWSYSSILDQSDVTSFKSDVKIPRASNWYFVVERVSGDTAEVKLVVTEASGSNKR